ncbi:glycine/betaine/sarcosine/D-proline reductase family selenoprotein B [Erysipelotrichaceae bacterium OH741_COT-311]|nr:GrdB-related putative oxidoreductase [Erysipelotrichaceae bacterium]RRC92404.1 glycine/betaine/sarcosine/D-proline reductase family selenoprotein B [Erysipelotrichaceae bacterium OH741_COT-311]
MKVVLVFDQGLAGLGGKGNTHLPLTIQKGGIGSYLMLKPHFEEIHAEVIATLSCGIETFMDNPDDVVMKLCAMIKKLNPDFVLAGPCFDFKEFSLMSARVCKLLKEKGISQAVTMMSSDNTKVILDYAKEIDIIKMPKKGGTGLKDSFVELSKYMDFKYNQKAEFDDLRKQICY